MSSPSGGFTGDDLDLVVVGDCNPDVVITGPDVTPAFGQRERLVEEMSLRIGRSATITAVAAARLGLRVALVAAVGDDPAAELMMSLLAREHVRTGAVVVRPGLATGMTTVLSTGADRASLTALGAIATLSASDVPVDLLGRARHLHIGSYFLLADCLGPGLPALLAQARRRGLSTSLDTNDDPAGRWGGDGLAAALTETEVFLPNEAEALAITGQPDLAGAAVRLAAAGRAVVIKLGARGALCVSARSGSGSADPERAEMILVRLPAVRPVDTTGAGDCFNAGLVAGLLRGLDLAHATALGCALGAASTQAPGGTGAVVGAETAQRLASTATFSLCSALTLVDRLAKTH